LSEETKDISEKILELLSHESYITTKWISERLGLSRNTASKYLMALSIQNKVFYKKAGPSKVWYTASDKGERAYLENLEAVSIFVETFSPVFHNIRRGLDLVKLRKALKKARKEFET